MLIVSLMFLRIWTFGILIFCILALNKWITGKEDGYFYLFIQDLLLASVWPFLLLSANGRRWLLRILNLN